MTLMKPLMKRDDASKPAARYRERGFTMVELLVATALSLLLAAGIVQVYISSKTNFRVNEGLARLQENARYAFWVINRDLRATSFLTCGSGNIRNPNSNVLEDTDSSGNTEIISNNFRNVLQDSDAHLLRDFADQSFVIYNAPASDEVPAGIDSSIINSSNDDLVEGSDVFSLKSVVDFGLKVEANMKPVSSTTSANLPLDTNGEHIEVSEDDVEAGDLAVVGDCTKTAVFQIGSYTESSGELTFADASLNEVEASTVTLLPGDDSELLAGSNIYLASNVTYFLALRDEDSMPVLYRRIHTNPSPSSMPAKVELVEGVESMQLSFGVDDAPGATGEGGARAARYLTAAELEAGIDGYTPDDIVSVRIGLLLRNVGRTVPDSAARTWDVNGENIDTDADGIQRQVFTTTIALRNRTI